MGQPQEREPAESDEPTVPHEPQEATEPIVPREATEPPVPAEPAERTVPQEPAASEPASDDDPTDPMPVRWTGSAPIPESGSKRRRRGVLREPTREMPTVDDEEPWPPPPPPRPANAPVTAPYPPPAPQVRAPVRTRPAPPRYAGRPSYPPPQVRRRRRRWPWVMAVLAALTALCCACCWRWIEPLVDEYPATATLPAAAAGLTKVDDAAARRTAAELELRVRAEHWLADQTFAAVYADDDRRRVTIYGATLFVLDPKQELNSMFAELTTEYTLTDAEAVPPGAPGGHVRCARGTANGQSAAVCAWTDHGSKAVAVFPNRQLPQSASLIRDLRAAIITRN